MLSAEILPSILKTKQTDDKRERECFFGVFFALLLLLFCIFFFLSESRDICFFQIF